MFSLHLSRVTQFSSLSVFLNKTVPFPTTTELLGYTMATHKAKQHPQLAIFVVSHAFVS